MQEIEFYVTAHMGDEESATYLFKVLVKETKRQWLVTESFLFNKDTCDWSHYYKLYGVAVAHWYKMFNATRHATSVSADDAGPVTATFCQIDRVIGTLKCLHDTGDETLLECVEIHGEWVPRKFIHQLARSQYAAQYNRKLGAWKLVTS